MNNSNNAIAKISPLYKNLIEAYEIKDKKARFNTCYDFANKATYEEIHLAITYIKEDNESGDVSSIPSEIVQRTINVLLLLLGDFKRRKAYLLDILEEARERKRP